MLVGVVGGGITGLSLVHALAERGVRATCFEAAEEPGGVIRSSVEAGRVLEHGPQRMRLASPVSELVESVGLDDELVVADGSLPLYVYTDGALRPVPRSLRGFLATDLLSWRGKLRVLAEPLTAPGRPDEMASALFARKFGGEAYRNLLAPLFGGIYASNPARMPARHAMEGLLRVEDREGSLLRAALSRLRGETPPPASFGQGLARLPERLAERYADRIELGTAVTGLASRGDAYHVETEGRTAVVDHVVVTTPAPAAADVLEPVASDAADRLRGLTYNPLALVHLVSDADPDGFGYQVAREAGLHTLGVTWNASLFGRDGVYTAFLGGMDDPDVVSRDDGALGSLAAGEFEHVMGAPAEAVSVTRLPHGVPAYDGSWDAVAGLELPDGITLATNYTGRMGISGRVRETRRLAATLADDGA